jgi:hypothetical protein
MFRKLIVFYDKINKRYSKEPHGLTSTFILRYYKPNPKLEPYISLYLLIYSDYIGISNDVISGMLYTLADIDHRGRREIKQQREGWRP